MRSRLACLVLAGAIAWGAGATLAFAASGTTSIVSASLGGVPGRFSSIQPQMSSDGRFVAFLSYADDLVPGDSNECGDIYVKDTTLGSVVRATVAVDKSQPNKDCFHPRMSSNGQFVCYTSDATNLMGSMDLNGLSDVYEYDVAHSRTSRVSWAPGSTDPQGSSYTGGVSDDGRYVAVGSSAPNLVPGDTNGVGDIFERDTLTSTWRLASVAHDGGPANGVSHTPSVSADGRYVAFVSMADNLVDDDGGDGVFVRDMVLGTTQRVDVNEAGQPANDFSYGAVISADGNAVVFYSTADNLTSNDMNGDYDIFVRDLVTRKTSCASLAIAGTTGNGQSTDPNLSADGRYVVFESLSSDLIVGDTNAHPDIFVCDTVARRTTRASVLNNGAQMTDCSRGVAAIDPTGLKVAFAADGIVDSSVYGYQQVVIRDMASPSTEPQYIYTSVSVDTDHPRVGESVEITGTVCSGSGAFGVTQPMQLESSIDGQHFTQTGIVTTASAEGTFSVSVHPTSTTIYRLAPPPSDQWSAQAIGRLATVKVVVEPHLRLIGALTLSPQSPYSINQRMSVTFTLTNDGNSPGTWLGVSFIVRGPRGETRYFYPTDQFSLDPGQSRTFTLSRRLDVAGECSGFMTACLASEPVEQDVPGSTVTFLVRPKAILSRSTSWSSLRRYKTYYATGFIQPVHAASDSNKVRILAYKRGADGTYHYVKSFSAKYSYFTAAKTRYRAAVRLTSKGHWKLVARHAADSTCATTYGLADFVRVR